MDLLIENVKYWLVRLSKTGFFHIFGASTFSNIISFASGIILIRLLSKVDYGTFSYAFNIYSFFAIVSGLGVTYGVLQLCSENMNNPIISKSIYHYGCSFGLTFNLLLSFSIVAFSLLFQLPVSGSNELLLFLSFYPIVTLAYEILTVKLRADIRAKDYSYVSIINTVIYFACSIVFAYLAGSKGLIMGRYISYIIVVYIIVKNFNGDLYIGLVNINKKIKRSFYYISLVSTLNNGLSTLFYLLEIAILGYYIKDSNIIASYKVATVIPTALNFIPLAFITYVYPYFARNRLNIKWVKSNYILSLIGMGSFNLCLSIFMILIAPFIINIVFGVQYMDSLQVFEILVGSYFIAGTFRILSGNLLVTQRQLTFNLIIAIVGSILSIVGNLLLIPSYGSVGAAYSHVIVVTVTGFLSTGYMFYILKGDD